MGLFEGQNVFTRAFKVRQGTVVVGKRFVKLDADGTVVPVSAVGDKPIGVALEDFGGTTATFPYVFPPRSGVAVRVMGTAFVEVGAAVNPGQLVEIDAQGRVVPQGTGTGATTVGVALQKATSAGQFIEVLLK